MTLADDSKCVHTAKAEARFHTKYSVDENGCWVWKAARTTRGYGQFSLNDRSVLAHRVAYLWFVGPLSPEIQLDHLCRNRACCNPAHLDPVTCKENLNRGINHHAQRTHCPYGHPLDGLNGNGARKCRTCNRQRMSAARTKGSQ